MTRRRTERPPNSGYHENMTIRTLKFALHHDPANSWAIGYHATQQNAAYNHAVDALNREPNLPKRSGRNHQKWLTMVM